MPKHFCTFCGYTRNNRTYRVVGTDKYPDDEVCNLCDTEVSDGQSGDTSEVAEDSGDAAADESGKDNERLSVALRRKR